MRKNVKIARTPMTYGVMRILAKMEEDASLSPRRYDVYASEFCAENCSSRLGLLRSD